ncbi:MAG: tetratricopeptide repeat protein [Phycisphaerales bacterium]|nr:tetratricopeptide repeat protein [Phycisphaerales bacterium]
MKNPEQMLKQAYAAANQGNLQLALLLLGELFSFMPHMPRARHLAAACHMRRGDFQQAIVHAKLAVELEPRNYSSRGLYGICLINTGSPDEGLAQLRVACQLGPTDTFSWNNLGATLNDRQQYGEAIEVFQKTLTLSQPPAQAVNGLAWALLNVGRAAEAIALVDSNLPKYPNDLMLIRAAARDRLYADGPAPTELAAAHRRLGDLLQSFAPRSPALPKPPTPADADRTLRVGLISPDLYGHSVSRFIEPLLHATDRSKINFALYACQSYRDEISGVMEQASAFWYDASSQSDAVVAAAMREHGLDIAIDLAGHMPNSRVEILAHRPAPITISYLGYPHSTGIPRVDYRIVDSYTDPVGAADQWATEKLLRLDPCFLCFGPAIMPPPVADLPEGDASPICFGSFNAVAKYSPETIAMWAEILKAVPDSTLLLKSYSLADTAARTHLGTQFSSRGVDPMRVEMIGQTPRTYDHLSAYHRVHIALDSYPYHGTTTTCEALMMGVPVVTRIGETHHARVSGSLLTSVGVPELIATDHAGYVRIATELARDRSRLRQYRLGLREKLGQSPLTQAQGFAERFESLLRSVWRERCLANRD